MSGNFSEALIAPCGMNCGICSAFLRAKNKCPGCRLFTGDKPVSRARCIIRNCEFIKGDNPGFCFNCDDYPCKRLKNLDKRYRNKYKMSEIENLEYIKDKGIAKLIEKERIKWTCSHCGGTINVHKQVCSECGKAK